MNQLATVFQSSGFTAEEGLEISKLFALQYIKAGEFFVRNEQFAGIMGFVSKGIFQYCYDYDGEEVTTYIALKNHFILSVQSFFGGQGSKENIKALVDSEVWCISRADFERLRETIPGFKDFYIHVLEQLLVCLNDSRFDYITLKPEERYAKLIREEPELIKQIPLKYLSALIGVTPRHLSRIRSNIR